MSIGTLVKSLKPFVSVSTPVACHVSRSAAGAFTSAQPQNTATASTQTTAPTTRPHPVVYHPEFQISPIPDDHRFPMPKDHLLYLALQAEGLAQLTFTPTYPDAATLCLVHDEHYVSSFLDGSISQQQMRKIGLPWSQKLVQRTLIGTGSAILAARLALQYGVACMTNGGTHHAHRSHGSGEPSPSPSTLQRFSFFSNHDAAHQHAKGCQWHQCTLTNWDQGLPASLLLC